MRWDALFGDLDSQWHSAERTELEREVNELARVEASQATFADALRGALGGGVSAVLRNGVAHHGTLVRVEEQWLLLEEGGRFVVVPLSKLLRVQGLGVQHAPRQGRARHSLASALRVLAHNRAVVVLELDAPVPCVIRGVLDRVGADHLALTLLADGVARVRDNVQGGTVVPLEAVLAVMSSTDNEL